MSNGTHAASNSTYCPTQLSNLRGLSESEKNELIISIAHVDGTHVTLSRYSDDIWYLNGFSTNVRHHQRHLNFKEVPSAFKTAMKDTLFRYLQRGIYGNTRPKGGSARIYFYNILPFLRHLTELHITSLKKITPSICAAYVEACKSHTKVNRPRGQPLAQSSLHRRFTAVEALYALSQYTDDQMPEHPWPDTSALSMAGLIGHASRGKTLLIPDDIFCTLFKQAYDLVNRGDQLLDLRDSLISFKSERLNCSDIATSKTKKRLLRDLGWNSNLREFNKTLIDLRTACYIVIASTSGCRNHELANLQSGAHHRSRDEEGTIYHWMRSRSEKTSAGQCDWMIPTAAVRSLRVMERWSTPLQSSIANEIAERRRANPQDPQIAEAIKHRHALFLGDYQNNGNQVRTLSNNNWNHRLRLFAKNCGLTWNLATHQFRRKFANYAAHSKFGDLRYLKEHYVHCSLDMTLGYAMDDSWGQHLDLELYEDIKDELIDLKTSSVDEWLESDTLSGGFGRSLKRWQRQPQNLLIFPDHRTMLKSIAESIAIRSNGHAWCTADNDGCIGNTLERTRCGGCNNAVIGPRHTLFYQRIYDELKALLNRQDIGEGGRQRVLRDLNRCREVLNQLGFEPEV